MVLTRLGAAPPTRTPLGLVNAMIAFAEGVQLTGSHQPGDGPETRPGG
jgi:hypothetical protein